MVYTRSPDYLYRRNGIYYFTRNLPAGPVAVIRHVHRGGRRHHQKRITFHYQNTNL